MDCLKSDSATDMKVYFIEWVGECSNLTLRLSHTRAADRIVVTMMMRASGVLNLGKTLVLCKVL